jgi:flagellar basal-body rod protein FlgC
MLFAALNTTGDGLTADQMWMDVISNNLANSQSTVTPQGGPFREQLVQLAALPLQPDGQGGVVVSGIVASAEPFPLAYQPGNPQANAQGYVAQSNVDVTAQMVDLLAASRAYQANATVFSDLVKEEQAGIQI